MEIKISKGLVKYEDALQIMHERVENIIVGKKPNMIWLLEHEPVYTAGTSANEADLLNHDLPVFNVCSLPIAVPSSKKPHRGVESNIITFSH